MAHIPEISLVSAVSQRVDARATLSHDKMHGYWQNTGLVCIIYIIWLLVSSSVSGLSHRYRYRQARGVTLLGRDCLSFICDLGSVSVKCDGVNTDYGVNDKFTSVHYIQYTLCFSS